MELSARVLQPTVQLVRPSYDANGRMIRTDSGFMTEERYVRTLNASYCATAQIFASCFADVTNYTAEDLSILQRRLVSHEELYVLRRETVHRAQVTVLSDNNEPAATIFIGITDFGTVAMLIGVGYHIIDPFDFTIVWNDNGLPAMTELLSPSEVKLFRVIRASCMQFIL